MWLVCLIRIADRVSSVFQFHPCFLKIQDTCWKLKEISNDNDVFADQFQRVSYPQYYHHSLGKQNGSALEQSLSPPGK